MININKKIFYTLYNLSLRYDCVKSMMIIISIFSSKVFFVLYVANILYLLYKKDISLVVYILAPFISLLSVIIIRKKFNRKRPFEELGIKAFIEHEKGGSFPSKHSTSAMIIAISTLSVNLYLALLMIILAIVTGLSRVFVGVHYPLDILGGFSLALLVNFLLIALINFLG